MPPQRADSALQVPPPYVSPELVRYLEQVYPDRIPRVLIAGDIEILVSQMSGRQQVIDKLRQLSERIPETTVTHV